MSNQEWRSFYNLPLEKKLIEFLEENNHMYGAAMRIASNMWREKDPVGAFTVGPCYRQVEVHGDYFAAVEERDRLRKELEEKEELADKRMLEAQDWEDEYHALKRRYEELDNSALEKHELLMDAAAKYQAVSKELERLRSALETSLYHLKKEYYMSAEDCIEEALALGQEEEGNQDEQEALPKDIT